MAQRRFTVPIYFDVIIEDDFENDNTIEDYKKQSLTIVENITREINHENIKQIYIEPPIYNIEQLRQQK